MSEQILDDTFVLCQDLLNSDGHVEQINMLTFAIIYEDDKILIEGRLAPSTRDFDRIIVLINMPSTPEQNPSFVQDSESVFKMPSKVKYENWTQVYLWLNRSQFIRQGAWMKYIESINRSRRDDTRKAYQLNRKPIDDSSLFKST